MQSLSRRPMRTSRSVTSTKGLCMCSLIAHCHHIHTVIMAAASMTTVRMPLWSLRVCMGFISDLRFQVSGTVNVVEVPSPKHRSCTLLVFWGFRRVEPQSLLGFLLQGPPELQPQIFRKTAFGIRRIRDSSILFGIVIRHPQT